MFDCDCQWCVMGARSRFEIIMMKIIISDSVSCPFGSNMSVWFRVEIWQINEISQFILMRWMAMFWLVLGETCLTSCHAIVTETNPCGNVELKNHLNKHILNIFIRVFDGILASEFFAPNPFMFI